MKRQESSTILGRAVGRPGGAVAAGVWQRSRSPRRSIGVQLNGRGERFPKENVGGGLPALSLWSQRPGQLVGAGGKRGAERNTLLTVQ